MAPPDPHRPSGAPARDLRAVLGPGQAPQVPPLPSSLLIVTVISTWSEAQSWSLLLFLPLLSPASQLLADVCVCVSQPGTALSRTWRRRGRPHAGYATQPLSREGPLLYFHLWCSPRVQVPARASSLAASLPEIRPGQVADSFPQNIRPVICPETCKMSRFGGV